MPEVNAEQGRAGRPGHLGGPQQRAVAAQDDHHLGVLGRLGSGRDHIGACGAEVGRFRGQDPDVDACGGEHLSDQPRAVPRRGPACMRHDEHRALAIHSGPSAMTASSRPGSSGGAPRRSQRKYSTFPAGPGSGLAAIPATPRPDSAAAAATRATAAARSPRSRTTPPAPTRPLPTSNWGFTRSTKSASGLAQLLSAGRTKVSEMKDRSAVTSVRGRGDLLRPQLAHVDPVKRDDPRVAAQPPGQLAVANIHRDHLLRAGAEQDIGEPAGGRARVEAAPAGHGQARESRQRARQFPAAAGCVVGHSGQIPDRDRVIRRDLGGGFAGHLARHHDPADGDELSSVLTGARESSPHQFGVQPSPRAHAVAAPLVQLPGAAGLTEVFTSA